MSNGQRIQESSSVDDLDDVRVVNPSIKSERSNNEESKSKKSQSSQKKSEPERLDQAQFRNNEVEV